MQESEVDKKPIAPPIRVDKIGFPVGGVITLNGHPCKLVNINTGRNRLTFEPITKESFDLIVKAQEEMLEKAAKKAAENK